METPQRPRLPGTWMQTPAPAPAPASLTFSTPNPRNGEVSYPNIQAQPRPGQETREDAVQGQRQMQQIPQISRPAMTLTEDERADRAINRAFENDAAFPDLDTYLTAGHSNDYYIENNPPWPPFQKVNVHQIPDQIFEQYNRASTSTSMGLFAEIHHAWVTIDNALYIWDYTVPNAQLMGFEGQTSLITCVKLARPMPGIFLPTITYILVLATVSEIILLGLGTDDDAALGHPAAFSLVETGISHSVKGHDITCIESTESGRLFFAVKMDNEVYELKYSSEDRWFSRRVAIVKHGGSAFDSLTSFFRSDSNVFITQIAPDDSRDLLYTLSSDSSLRVFGLEASGNLRLAVTKSVGEILTSSALMGRSDQRVGQESKIVSISAIPRVEAEKFHLVAVTASGYRLFLNATQQSGWGLSVADSSMQMQVHHVRYPPPSSFQNIQGNLQLQSRENAPVSSLSHTRLAARYPPGYFFCAHSSHQNQNNDILFIACPDPARLAKPSDDVRPAWTAETAVFHHLGSRAEDLGVSQPFKSERKGYGNELQVQFDEVIPEVAVMTNTGIHIFRRTRLVDGFVSLAQKRGGSEGLETDVKNFIRLYGRTEILATALAVACGQGIEVSASSRPAQVNDPAVLEFARKIFIEYGGRPIVNQNVLPDAQTVGDQNISLIDLASPSPRHTGTALYLSRLLRSTWKTLISREERTPEGGYYVHPVVSLNKIKNVQENLSWLQRFFKENQSFIAGLSGPETGTRGKDANEAAANQCEHRAVRSVVRALSRAIEALAFVLVLFDERVEDIVTLLAEESRPIFHQLTFEQLILSPRGFELAKELVKAIVNRNIAKGSNVETVAEALRRRCGSFCSAEDVIIFKAQDFLKRAAEAGSSTEIGRNLLNESLTLFKQVAESLSLEYLAGAVQRYCSLQFYAGAIQLALKVAHESDKANDALSWVADDKPINDGRVGKFEIRENCYGLIHGIIEAVESAMADNPGFVDGRPSLIAVRRNEAEDLISHSTDTLFLTNLYDWYLQKGWSDRLLRSESPFVKTYLERSSTNDLNHADLLWKYHGQSGRYLDAAVVQLQLAKSSFTLTLDRRIEYLSQARANASTHTQGVNRKDKQKLLQEVTEFLEVAALQDEILQKLKDDDRLTNEHRDEVLGRVDGQILDISQLYNEFADNAGYFDICLLIYAVADHRDPIATKNVWQHLLQDMHDTATTAQREEPWELVAEKVRSLGNRLRFSEHTFPVPMLLPLLEKYAHDHQPGAGPSTWMIDIFLELQTRCEIIFDILEGMWYANEPPFAGRNRAVLASHLLYIANRWMHDTIGGGGVLFDSEAGSDRVDRMLETIIQSGIADAETLQGARVFRGRMAQILR